MSTYNLNSFKEAVDGDLEGFLDKRKDVRVVLEMPHVNFNMWYTKRRDAVEVLLDYCKYSADIPSFKPGSDGNIFLMRNNRTPALDAMITDLEAALSYLNLIKDLKEKGLGRVK